LTAISALALGGCAGFGGPGSFRLSADEVQAAWRRSLQPEEREAERAGTYPAGLIGPFFSEARCRWTEPGRKAACRYRISRGMTRPGSERHWTDDGAELVRTEDGWSF
jgi:hypothetical protein